MGITVGFIGCGNMGGAIAKAVASTKKCDKILLSDNYLPKAEELAESMGGSVSDNDTVSAEADIIFLGVKPQVLASVVDGIKNKIANRDMLVVSMAAGISTEKIQNMFDTPISLIRIMPNTPVSIGEGMILFTSTEKVTNLQKNDFLSIMSMAGVLDEIPENLIDAASALSGCGPAFVYMFIEALADGGVACGLPRDKAMMYAAQTLLGSAKLQATSGKHPGELKDAVCSPGGSTIVGVKTLENGSMRGTVMNAVINAFEKTKDLGK